MNINRFAERLAQMESRPAPLSEPTTQIKNKLLNCSYSTGVLVDHDINDILESYDSIEDAYVRNHEEVERLHSRTQEVVPKVAPVSEDDPFI